MYCHCFEDDIFIVVAGHISKCNLSNVLFGHRIMYFFEWVCLFTQSGLKSPTLFFKNRVVITAGWCENLN